MRLRLIVLLCAALALTVGVATATAGGGTSGGGNAANAKLCQKGGWTKWVTAEKTPFASEEACVAYAAQGFTLYPSPADLSVSLTPHPRVARTNVLINLWALTVSNAGPGSANGVIVDFYCDAPAQAIFEVGNFAPEDNPNWSSVRVDDYHLRLSYALPLASGATSPMAPVSCGWSAAGPGHVEISASSTSDPDSTPNNGVTTEDDYAALVPAADLSVSVGPVGPPWDSTVVPNALAVTVKNSGPAPADGVTLDLYCDPGSPNPHIGWFTDEVWTNDTPQVVLNGNEQLDASHTRFHLPPIDPASPGNYGQQWRVVILCETLTSPFADWPPIDLRPGHVEISGSSVPDTDSTPNNGATTEDDYAAFGPGT